MESKMLIGLILLAIISVVDRAQATCPEKYSRFSVQHSFCKERNLTCSIIKAGVNKDDRKVILKVHNKLRNRVATGKEKRAGGLPTSANMLQMEWDFELASIAQKWAEQCVFKRDCQDCRRVENFHVGQNIAKEYGLCSSSDCGNITPNWKASVTKFYKEVSLFSKSYIRPFHHDDKFGQFTQVVLANSWKVGCGYVAFRSGNGAESIYVCNYGPGVFNVNKPLYKTGPPCSACPLNTCCGCKVKGPKYSGLCKVRNLSMGPVYEKMIDSLLDCNWSDERSPCQVKENERKGWKLKRAPGGFYKTITLKAGEKSMLELITPVQPKSNTFCVVILLRKGPSIAAEKDSSIASLLLDIPEAQHSTSMNLKVTTASNFMTIYNDIGWNKKTKLTFEVYIPPNAPNHIIDVKEISAFDGVCDNPRIKESY